MLPTFVCIGPGRAGTSWLYEILWEHPEIGMARNIKETEFFDLNYEKGVEWYSRFFNGLENKRAIGEITNRYIFCEDAAARICKHIPHCKLIVCLRDPFDRLVSNYLFKIREGAINCSLEDALQVMPALVDELKYYKYLKNYFDRFADSQFFYIDFDRLEKDAEGLCADIYKFIGVNEAFEPAAANRKVNKSITPRARFIPYITKRSARMLRAIGAHKLLTELKRSDVVKGLLFKDVTVPHDVHISADIRTLVGEQIRDDIRQLEARLGRSLGWFGGHGGCG